MTSTQRIVVQMCTQKFIAGEMLTLQTDYEPLRNVLVFDQQNV